MEMELRFMFSPKKLSTKIPTKLDVLKAFMYERERWMVNQSTKKGPPNYVIAAKVTEQIKEIYTAAGIKTIQDDRIKAKVISIYKSRLELLRIPRSQRYALSNRVQHLKTSLSMILDITCKNNTPDTSNTVYSQNVDAEHSLYEDSSSEMCSDGSDEDYQVSSSESSSPVRTKKMDLSEVVDAKVRYTTSGRATAAIVNATLRMAGLSNVIVDKSKLERAEKRRFSEIDKIKVPFGGGLYYDGRKDYTIQRTEKRDETGKLKYYRTVTREDHYSLVSQPEGLFLGYVVAPQGKAHIKSRILVSFLEQKDMLKDLIALGSDGENNNVGSSDGGINFHIEAIIQRPLHWFICLLHANELPLKNLIQKLDGPTTSGNTLSGPIGKLIMTIVNPPIVRFKKFSQDTPLTMPNDVYKTLSNDQKYLFRIVNALITGEFPDSLQQLKIGPYNQSRWITTASRICLLYASTKKPCKTLNVLASYVVNIYAPTWFQIKKNELAIYGPKNLFFLIDKIKLMKNAEAQAIVKKCVQRNAFFAHSENVLLGQLASKNKNERHIAVNKILEIRKRPVRDGVRRFKVPQINYEAKSWIDIAIADSGETEPPFTLTLSETKLKNIILNPLQVPKYKCHTQMVERAVKEVTRVSANAISSNKRNSMVKATLVHRAKYPKLDSAKDHVITSRGCQFLPKI